MKNLNMPMFRAKRARSDEYVFGVPRQDSKGMYEMIINVVDDGIAGVIQRYIDPTTLAISFDNSKSFIKLSDLEIHTCTDFELKYTNMKMRNCKEVQPPNGNIFTIITDKGR